MGRITVSIVLNASPQRVWQVVEPIERHVDWMADAVAIRFEGAQTRGTGTKFLCDTKVGPIRLTDRMEITSWIPEREMGVKHVGLVTGTGVFTLASEGSGTRFTWSEELKFPWWLGGRLGELVGGQLVMKRIWKRNLAKLAALM